MDVVIVIGAYFVSLIHMLFAIVEIGFWKHPSVFGRLKKLELSQAEANKVAPIVANAGLYNAFLAGGLALSVILNEQSFVIYFLCCAILAGIFGAQTLSWKTLIFQSLPAVFVLIGVFI